LGINLVNLAIAGVALYAVWRYKDKIGSMFQGLGSSLGGGTGAPSKGGKFTPLGGTAGGTKGCGGGIYGTGQQVSAKDSGKKTRHFASDGSSGTTEWNADGINWPAAEAVVYVTPGGCKDNSDIKMWGPHHSDGACCWCIASIEWKDGSVYFGGEGPHPKTDKTQQKVGQVKTGGTVGLLFAIWPGAGGAHQEIAVDDGGGWRKLGARDGPCGYNKKSTKPVSGYQAQFRTDCSGVKLNCAYVRQITGKGSAMAYAMGVPYNGYTDSPRYRKAFYSKYPGISKAYRATRSRSDSDASSSSFFVTVEHYTDEVGREISQSVDLQKTDTEKEDSVAFNAPYHIGAAI
jgi:hypothetical protein